MSTAADIRVRQFSFADLTASDASAVRRLLDRAFAPGEDEGFTDDDWDHALGGQHFVAERDGWILGHASVVERQLHVAGHALRAGYVEAVATDPEEQGSGIGTKVMRRVGEFIQSSFQLGALGTGSHGFYARLGWVTWLGPSSVRTSDGERPTLDDDGYIMVLATPTSPPLNLEAPISCEWRPGDVW